MLSSQQTKLTLFLMFVVAVLVTAPVAIGNDESDDDARKAKVAAPAGTVQLSTGLGGSFYVDQQLIEKYKALKTRVQRIKDEIAAGDSSSESALRQLAEIEVESAKVRQAIDANKTFVSAFKVFKVSETTMFRMADSRRIVVRGDNVTIRGWAGPGIKTVVEKTILAKEKPPESEFSDIKIRHDVSVAEDLVGRTQQQRAADEEEFQNSPQGKQMTIEQLETRRIFLEELFGSYQTYADFQGKSVNNLSVSGLDYETGNRQLTMRINSPGGGANLSSQWQRHAAVTIYVPPCEHLLVAGCMVKLDIENVTGNLLLTTRESRYRDYEGTFEVRKIDGDVTVYQAPVRILDEISGNVQITATEEFVNSGTHHEDGLRTAYSFETQATTISNVKKNLAGWFLRTDLHLHNLGGVIDVRNEYGETHLEWNDQAKIDQPMRVISESGKINLTGPRSVLETIPLYAYTLCGTLRIDLSRKVLDDVNFSTGNPRRSWSGFVTPSKDSFTMEKFERPMQAWENAERKPGLDLISRSGRVSITTVPPAE